jgi:isocitrate dehydrogenase kinase/phosphatase
VEFWRGVQHRLAAGEVVDVFPYRRNEELGRERTDGRADRRTDGQMD